MTPRAPAVAPSPAPAAPRPPMPSTTAATITVGASTARHPEEPPSGDWDAADADTVTNADQLADTPRQLPKVLQPTTQVAAPPATQGAPATNVPATPHSPGTVRGPYQTSPGVGGPPPDLPGPRVATAVKAGGAAAATAALPSAMREEVWAIVRAAVDEAISPLVARQRDLEARAERAERFADAAKNVKLPVGAGIPGSAAVMTASTTAASLLASIAPGAPSIPVALGSVAPEPLRIAPRSLPPTDSYGVTVMPSTRPTLSLEGVGAVDISGFDGGKKKQRVAIAVVVIILAIVAAVVTMTLMSHT